MPIDEGRLPRPTISKSRAKAPPTPPADRAFGDIRSPYTWGSGAPGTGPAKPPPLRPTDGDLPTGSAAWWLRGSNVAAFGQGGIPGQGLTGAPGVSPLSTEAQRLLNAGSVQQVFAQRALQQWNNRIALSDAQEVFKNMNAGYAQALYAAELWAQNNTPTQPALSGGGSGYGGFGYGGFGGGGDPRGYALSMGLYNWRIT